MPSGDRTLARLLLAALTTAGFEPALASTLRSFSVDGARQNALLEAGETQANEVAARLMQLASQRRPRLWFTYHNHYKAPDLLGPAVSRALAIPYVIAEASHAPKRAGGPFDRFHHMAAQASLAADLHLVLNPRDGAGLAALRAGTEGLVPFAPFTAAAMGPAPLPIPEDGPLRLMTAAMMRPGDKFQSYRVLADALGRLDCDWTLDVAGDGTARAEVEALFEGLGARVRFHGLIDGPAELAAFYRAGDLLAWPGVNEAFGMTYLEAAREGRAAVAMRYGGVATVVADGASGILTEAGDVAAFSATLDRLARNRALLRRLGAQARNHTMEHHGPEAAARRLRETLCPLLKVGDARCAS